MNLFFFFRIPIFSYETISELREQEMTFLQISEHLNKKKVEKVRCKKFRGPHVHSILKKRRLRRRKFVVENNLLIKYIIYFSSHDVYRI